LKSMQWGTGKSVTERGWGEADPSTKLELIYWSEEKPRPGELPVQEVKGGVW